MTKLENYVTDFQFFYVPEELKTRAFKWRIYRPLILSIAKVTSEKRKK